MATSGRHPPEDRISHEVCAWQPSLLDFLAWFSFMSFVQKSLERHVPGWVMSPALEFGKYGYSRHVESAFYCFLL